MQKIKKEMGIGALLIIACLLLINLASAFAISSPYWKDYPLKLMPGDSRDVQFVIVNQAGDSDLKVRVNILEGNDSIKITDSSNIYDAKLGTKTPVNFLVNVPQDAKIGDSYEIKLEFTTLVQSQSGNFGISNSIGKSFPLIIGEEASAVVEPIAPAKTGSNIWIYILIAIAILIVVIITISKAKKRK